MDLRDRTAIVTGSGGGIGRALALEFGRRGARVVCCARRASEIEATAEAIRGEGGTALAVAVDVTVPEQVERLVAATMDAFGRIDLLFNNAGRFASIGPVWEADPESWWRDVTVNLRGPMLTARAALPHMMARDEGVIVNMSGGGSTSPLPGGSAYGSSKAALLRLTETLARELERVGSKVLAVAMGPGLVRTEMTEIQVQTEAGRQWIPSTGEAFEAGRSRPPEDCARATVEMLRVICPEMNGRIFGVGNDFADIARHAAEIREQDRMVLRMKN